MRLCKQEDHHHMAHTQDETAVCVHVCVCVTHLQVTTLETGPPALGLGAKCVLKGLCVQHMHFAMLEQARRVNVCRLNRSSASKQPNPNNRPLPRQAALTDNNSIHLHIFTASNVTFLQIGTHSRKSNISHMYVAAINIYSW